MPIKHVVGNLMDARTEALVNPVNTVGVMGAGLALRFRDMFPHNTSRYQFTCEHGGMIIGRMLVTYHKPTSQHPKLRWIINFPTKLHYSKPSRLEWIVLGLTNFKKMLLDLDIKSVAMPRLGCGLGGLLWSDVRPLIVKELKDLDDVEVLIYSYQK